jgi:RES domain-containing protein
LTFSLWRISNHDSLSGKGGLRASARWHTAGHRIVYLAESPPGSLIEVLVNLKVAANDWPKPYMLLRIDGPANVEIESLSVPAGEDWPADTSITRKLGDEWLRSGRTVLARAPSSIMPSTWNLLFNPDHRDAKQFRIVDKVLADYDQRFFQLREERENKKL